MARNVARIACERLGTLLAARRARGFAWAGLNHRQVDMLCKLKDVRRRPCNYVLLAVDNLGCSHACGQLLQAVVYGQCDTGRESPASLITASSSAQAETEEGLGCDGRCPTTCVFNSKLAELHPRQRKGLAAGTLSKWGCGQSRGCSYRICAATSVRAPGVRIPRNWEKQGRF